MGCTCRHADEADPLALHFQPDGDQCQYFAYRREELLRHLLVIPTLTRNAFVHLWERGPICSWVVHVLIFVDSILLGFCDCMWAVSMPFALQLPHVCLQANEADILVAGDSMMRQIFSRLVQMMRGQRRILDCAFSPPPLGSCMP